MRNNHRPSPSSWRAWLAVVLLCGALAPADASAQAEPRSTWAVVPLLGFGSVRDGGDWSSAGLEAAIELEYAAQEWRWSVHASMRGIGVACSHVCFDGGSALAFGTSRSLGAFSLGGGAGVMGSEVGTA